MGPSSWPSVPKLDRWDHALKHVAPAVVMVVFEKCGHLARFGGVRIL
jgi:hypothetical protein